MRSSLVTGELFLVRALGYDLEVSLPFTYCLHVLRSMSAVPWFKNQKHRHQKDVWRRMEQEMNPELSTIARLAWMFCWDR